MDKCYVIPVQKKCNADCLFCISKTRDYDKEEEILIPNDKFINTLHLLAKRGVNRFEITGGGEPFLNPFLEEIILLIRSIKPSAYIKLYTNGNILKPVHGIDELNISVVHYDSIVNNEFMHSKNNISLDEKLTFFRNNMKNVKIRLSIPLIKGGIDSASKLDSFINKTSGKVDEYVVRTLYPHTVDLEKLYVDFEYSKGNVIFERENNLDTFSGLILWTDSNLYSNWDLVNQKHLYSYMLLKPDSQSKIDIILDYIKSKGFEIINILRTDNFINFASQLYQDKNFEYFKKVKRHLENSAYLFGNVGLILILDGKFTYEELLEKTYLLKQELREKFGFTHAMKGYLLVGDNISHLNLVHAPDPISFNYERDLEYINGSSLKKVNDEEMSLVLKHRSYYI